MILQNKEFKSISKFYFFLIYTYLFPWNNGSKKGTVFQSFFENIQHKIAEYIVV